MGLPALLALLLGGLAATLQSVAALQQADIDAMWNSYNKVFLNQTGSSAYYEWALNDTSPDGTWAASLDILVALDAYEITGDSDRQTLVENLLNTWLVETPPPWSWDGYNDDIGWYTLSLIRGYQYTQNSNFLNQAVYGYDYAFGRGWDTQYNGGGIWEQQPNTISTAPNKTPLANDSLGKVACLLYQATHNSTYLDQAQEIYNWVWHNLFNPQTGEIYEQVNEDGTFTSAPAAYNQGTFIDFANLLYKMTQNTNIYNDAMNALNFAKTNVTVNGIFSDDAPWRYDWADEMARGAYHYIQNNRLWDTYWSWMVDNANSIITNRRTDLNITWNAWDTPTPQDNTLRTSKFISAMAWLLLTPPTQPDARGGLHLVVNQQTGLAMDSAGTFGNGNDVIQWANNGGQNQLWEFTQNSDTSWNIINLATWQALDCPGSSTEAGITMDQWQPTRAANQRWWVDQQSDGSYKIWNQASTLSLDGAANSTNGAVLEQADWTGASQQRWLLQ